jgi:hypothetical protein
VATDSDNRQTVRAALQHAEAQAQRRRKVTRWVFVVLGATVLMSCLLVLGAVR